MKTIAAILLLAVLALAGHRKSFVKVLPSRAGSFFFLTGTEFLLVGYLLGDSFLGVLDTSTLAQIRPFLIVGLGWIGLLAGIQLEWKALGVFRPASYLWILLSGCCVLFLVSAGLYGLFHVWFPYDPQLGLAVAVLAVTALCTAQASIALWMQHVSKEKRPLGLMLHLVSSVNDVIAVVLFGLLVGFYQPAQGAVEKRPSAALHSSFVTAADEKSCLIPQDFARLASDHFSTASQRGCFSTPAQGGVGFPLFPLQKFVVSLLLGTLMGLLLLMLFRTRLGEVDKVLIVMGLVLFGGGMAYLLGISPLLLHLVAGMILANLSLKSEEIYRLLMGIERPLYLIFLMFAGAYLHIGSPLVVLLAVAYALIRALSQGVAGRVFLRRAFPDPQNPPTRALGWGLTSQAGIGVALAVHFHLWIAGPSSLPILNITYSVLLLAILLNELISPFGLAYVTKEK